MTASTRLVGAKAPDPEALLWTLPWDSRCPRLSASLSRAMERRRRALLRRCLALGARRLAGGWSKLFTGTLSPGCRVCVAGAWSYLETNQLCGRGCFYCPRPQDRRSLPYEKFLGLSFRSPRAYAEALRASGHRGAGLSGGEPLRTLPRTLAHLRALRRRLGPQARLWLYTSGGLATEERLRALRAAGLDEIRINVSSSGYALDAVRRAARIVPVVAVEIPAVPEDEARVRALLPELVRAGAKHLILHQLTCTPHNDAEFRARGYHVTDNGPFVSPSVVESELTALRLLRDALEARLPLAVNYCSFIFKNRYHALTRRARLSARLLGASGPFARPTRCGWIRRLEVSGPRPALRRLRERLPDGSARLEGSRLRLSPAVLADPLLADAEVRVRYSAYALEGTGKTGGPGCIDLGKGLHARFSEHAAAELRLRGRRERSMFAALFLGERTPGPPRGAARALRERFEGYEDLASGLHALS